MAPGPAPASRSRIITTSCLRKMSGRPFDLCNRIRHSCLLYLPLHRRSLAGSKESVLKPYVAGSDRSLAITTTTSDPPKAVCPPITPAT